MANERRSGKPSSIAWKPAEEMARSLDSRGVSGVPTETEANESGIEDSEELESAILVVSR